MTTPKFTPGPWRTDGAAIYGPTGRFICDLDKESTSPEDAALLLSAPDLYAALEAWMNNEKSSQECFTLTRAALAKARGEKGVE